MRVVVSSDGSSSELAMSGMHREYALFAITCLMGPTKIIAKRKTLL